MSKKSQEATTETKDLKTELTESEETTSNNESVALQEDLQAAETQNAALLETVLRMQNEMNVMKKAINNPVIISDQFETGEYKAGIDQDITNDGVIEMSVQTDPNTRVFKDKNDYEMFMKEKVTIVIERTSDPNADQLVGMAVNGDSYLFVRGVEQTCPRYIVNGFACAKPTNYINQEYQADDGAQMSRQVGTTGLRYPFRVVKDVSPIGDRWLQKVLATAA